MDELEARLDPMGPVPLPELAAVGQQAALRVPENRAKGELGQGDDPLPMRPDKLRVAGPQRVFPKRGDQESVLVELDLVGIAALARIDRVALRRYELREQPGQDRPGQARSPSMTRAWAITDWSRHHSRLYCQMLPSRTPRLETAAGSCDLEARKK